MRSLLAAVLAVLAVLCLPALAQDPAAGEEIYFGTCVRCHGFPPVNGPESAAWNPDQIRSAIANRVARMRFLSYLTDAQLGDVAAFIGQSLGVEPPPSHDPTDLWWDETQPGWGLSLVLHRSERNIVFGVIFTHGPDRRPMWLVMPAARWSLPRRFSGDLYRAAGAPFGGAFDPATVNVRPVGRMTIELASNDTATLLYSVDGVTVEKRISRQPF